MSEPFLVRTVSALRRQRLKEVGPNAITRARWWYAAALAAGILLFVLAGKAIGLFEPSPEQLVARAYEQNRTWQIRMTGASYSRLQSTDRSSAPASAALAEAEAVVLRGLEAHSRDRRWRELQSRVDFLHRRYGAAIEDLQPLDVGQSSPAELLIDLGTAYLGRGVAENQPSDKTRALEYFGRALRIEPANPVALFNLALASQEILAPAAAEQAWASYLAVDAKSGWADEARDWRRQAAQKKSLGLTN